MATCQQPWQEGKQLQEQHVHHGGCALPAVYSGITVQHRPRQGSLAPEQQQPPPPSPSPASGRSTTEKRALRVHSEAERRRRERINAHLATLRRMLPDAKQMDKASLLASVVNQVKDLKREAAETTAQATTTAPIPPEANEMTVQCYAAADAAGGGTHIRVSVACDDRPGLLADIAGAFHGLRLRPLRADMSSLGGRVQHVFVLCREEGDATASGSGCVRSLEEAVRQALAKLAFPEMVYSGSSRSKRRQRLLD
ncbi:hypothetical protein ABZP36_014055 [Zizania latifolia]